MSTPIRAALLLDSRLQALVSDGLSSVKVSDRRLFETAIRRSFADSLDLDAGLLEGHEQENRWDYLMGHRKTRTVMGLETHSAKNDEVSTVIAKRRAAIVQLRKHMKPSSSIVAWFWVASGRIEFVPYDRENLRLAQAGITFVGRMLREKHMPKPPEKPERKRRRG